MECLTGTPPLVDPSQYLHHSGDKTFGRPQSCFDSMDLPTPAKVSPPRGYRRQRLKSQRSVAQDLQEGDHIDEDWPDQEVVDTLAHRRITFEAFRGAALFGAQTDVHAAAKAETAARTDKMPPLVHCLPSPPQHRESGVLVSEVLLRHLAAVFSFDRFNCFQSACLELMLESYANVVISAPTAAGKTVLFELAIIRHFFDLTRRGETNDISTKALYLAPMRALCQEKAQDWAARLATIQLTVVELTGDTDEQLGRLSAAHVIVATPEKWDSISRRARFRSVSSRIGLLLLDEVHAVNLTNRGPILEVVVARLQLCARIRSAAAFPGGLRIVAVSATIPNIQDIGVWLGATPDSVRCFGSEFRPVPLEKYVLAYKEGKNEFLFQQFLDSKLAGVLDKYNPDGKPALVFCVTKSGCEKAARTLLKDPGWLHGPLNPLVREQLRQAARKANNKALQSLIGMGVAIHHGDLTPKDRQLVEELFLGEMLRAVFCTSTLALGVNLPCHIAVVKSTLAYQGGDWQEYDALEMLQMIGRAGRPRFDTVGKAVIMTEVQHKSKWESILTDQCVVESHFARCLLEALLVEISLETVTDLTSAVQWLGFTFLSARICSCPKSYAQLLKLKRGQRALHATDDATGMLCQEADRHPLLREPPDTASCLELLVQQALDDMHSVGLVNPGSKVTSSGAMSYFATTELGNTMAYHNVCFETMRVFAREVSRPDNLCGSPQDILQQLLGLLVEAAEFREYKPRHAEKGQLRLWGKSNIRWPYRTPVDTPPKKANVLIQMALCDTPATADAETVVQKSWDLKQQQTHMVQVASRLLRCLREVCRVCGRGAALAEAYALQVCLDQGMWETSTVQCRQMPNIGEVFSSRLREQGLGTFEAIATCNPHMIELATGRKPPFGMELQRRVRGLARVVVSISLDTMVVPGLPNGVSHVIVSVSPRPFGSIAEFSVWHSERDQTSLKYNLVVYNSVDGSIIHAIHFTTARPPTPFRVPVLGTGVTARLVCESLVGLDDTASFGVQGQMMTQARAGQSKRKATIPPDIGREGSQKVQKMVTQRLSVPPPTHPTLQFVQSRQACVSHRVATMQDSNRAIEAHGAYFQPGVAWNENLQGPQVLLHPPQGKFETHPCGDSEQSLNVCQSFQSHPNFGRSDQSQAHNEMLESKPQAEEYYNQQLSVVGNWEYPQPQDECGWEEISLEHYEPAGHTTHIQPQWLQPTPQWHTAAQPPEPYAQTGTKPHLQARQQSEEIGLYTPHYENPQSPHLHIPHYPSTQLTQPHWQQMDPQGVCFPRPPAQAEVVGPASRVTFTSAASNDSFVTSTSCHDITVAAIASAGVEPAGPESRGFQRGPIGAPALAATTIIANEAISPPAWDDLGTLEWDDVFTGLGIDA